MALGDGAPATRAPSLGEDFFAFCKDLGLIASGNLDQQQQQEDETGLPVPPMINDLYGALSVGVNGLDLPDVGDLFPQPSSSSFQQTLTPAGASSSVTPPPAAAGGGVPAAAPAFSGSHRAVITSMPFLPNSPTAAVAAVMSAAAAAAGGVPPPAVVSLGGRHRVTGGGDEEADTHSVDTMPMPHKRRRLTAEGGEEASSRPSPNDRAYQPTTTSSSVGGAASAHQQQQQQHQGAAAGNGGASSAAPTSTNNAAQQGSPVNPAGLTTSPSGTLKAVLVAKVLTKSDSSSKRIILPRIAVEANLPQVAQGGGHGKTFYFSATDPSGSSWPLCIKAWANGQNPKPVYVLEQVGDLMKQNKLGVGDAVAVLASQAGEFYIEWNTEQAKVAAARPTLSTFTFSHAATAAKGSGAAAGTAAAGGGTASRPQQQEVKQEPQQQQQQQEVTQQGLVISTSVPLPSPRATPPPPVAAAAAAAGGGVGVGFGSSSPRPVAVPSVQPSEQQQQQQQAWLSPFQTHAAAAAAAANATTQQQQQQQQQQVVVKEEAWDSSNPLPQELLSCERVLLPLEHPFDRVFDRPAASRSMFLTIDDSQPSLADGMGVGGMLPLAAAAGGAGGNVSAAAAAVHAVHDAVDQDPAAALEALMAAEGVVTDEGGAMHQGGYLVCPRTPGCTRPAGHQGWCVGHKGFKKRGRGSPPGPY